MYSISFTAKFYQALQRYTNNYLDYYENLYEDSGIWSHSMIMQGYSQETLKRYEEIVDLVEERLSSALISYPNEQSIIKWRSKILLVSFRDRGDTRIVTSIDIR